MKIAIHHTKGSFSDRWITYCEEAKIPYKIVNCYSNDIINQLEGCKALLWHHNHAFPIDFVMAKPLMFSLEQSGIKVFPDFKTAWHFDDKVGQKYLFESINAPIVPTHVFYTKKEALEWALQTSYPKVFKLRGGAGSKNVRLVNNLSEAKKLIAVAFGKGFRQYDAIGGIKEQLRKLRLKQSNVKELLKAAAHLVIPIKVERSKGREKGYVYFQDFIPENDSDIRIIVMGGEKAFAIKRYVRDNDFRASGSGHIVYDKKFFNDEIIELSFKLSNTLQSQCAAFDFVFLNGKPLVVEVSYGFRKEGYDPCPGYWTKDLQWHEGNFNPYAWMVDELIK